MFTLDDLVKQREAQMARLQQEIAALYEAAREKEAELLRLSGEYRLLVAFKNDGYGLNQPAGEPEPAGNDKVAKAAPKTEG
jgi:hypothetical protein